MQTLGQAVYGRVGYYSREGRRGVTEKTLVREMISEHYLEPVGERVRSALRSMLEDVSSGIMKGRAVIQVGERYYQKRVYLKSHRRR